MKEKVIFSDDVLIRRVWDQENIKNLIARYAFYEAANSRQKSINELWVSKPENMETASFGRNWGFYAGMENIKKYYIGRNRFGAVGTALMHPHTTTLLALAQDGKTAQGLWMGVSYESAPDESGILVGK